LIESLTNWLINIGLDAQMAVLMARASAVVAMLLLALIADVVARKLLLGYVKKLVERSKTQWDDFLLQQKFFVRIAHLAPALVLLWLGPVALEGLPNWIELVNRLTYLYVVLIILLAIEAVLDAFVDIYRTYPISKDIPIKSFVQVGKLVVFFIGAILIFGLLFNQSPLVFLSGLGALSAVLIIVFKDSILGFVAGVQLAANKMVARGDWISMPDYGADGDVLEVTLTTVKVQNWDKTITTIPTYALISDSFKNWRGMMESGGRRIKRAVNIDITSIKFCDAKMLEKFSKIQYISEYLANKQQEIKKYNEEKNVDLSSLVNGRHLTNIGTFRAYVSAYLRHHPKIDQEMTFLVRQLQPTPQGLPVEIYVFSSDQNWANYEGIQSDIFDHILAVVPEFELRVFQEPSGYDFRGMGKTV